MFDMGFTELMLIGIVALVVIGPERLPGVARTAGKYFGKLRRFMTNVKADVESELRADELREILNKQQDELQSLKKVVDEVGKDVNSSISSMEAEIDKASEEYQKKSTEEGSSWTDNIATPGLDAQTPVDSIETETLTETTVAKPKKVTVKKAKTKKAAPKAKAAPKSKATPKAKAASKAKPETTKSASE